MALAAALQLRIGQLQVPSPVGFVNDFAQVIPADRAARIENGFGAEGFLTDATTGAIEDEAIPLLRQQDYGGAIELMTLRVAERFAGAFNFQLDTSFRAPAPAFNPRRSRGPVGGSGGIN